VKKREVMLSKFREYFMLEIGLNKLWNYDDQMEEEDHILHEIIEEFRRR